MSEDQPKYLPTEQPFYLHCASSDLVIILLNRRMFALPNLEYDQDDEGFHMRISESAAKSYNDLDLSQLLCSIYLSCVVAAMVEVQISLVLSPYMVSRLKKCPKVYQSMMVEIDTMLKASNKG